MQKPVSIQEGLYDQLKSMRTDSIRSFTEIINNIIKENRILKEEKIIVEKEKVNFSAVIQNLLNENEKLVRENRRLKEENAEKGKTFHGVAMK